MAHTAVKSCLTVEYPLKNGVFNAHPVQCTQPWTTC